MVQVMTGLMVPQSTIARNLAGGISINTLKKHFAVELETGRDQYVTSLKTRMEAASRQGSVRATAWLLERLGGPDFAPRMRLGGMEDAPPIAVSTESRVTIYLPNNHRDEPKDGNGNGTG